MNDFLIVWSVIWKWFKDFKVNISRILLYILGLALAFYLYDVFHHIDTQSIYYNIHSSNQNTRFEIETYLTNASTKHRYVFNEDDSLKTKWLSDSYVWVLSTSVNNKNKLNTKEIFEVKDSLWAYFFHNIRNDIHEEQNFKLIHDSLNTHFSNFQNVNRINSSRIIYFLDSIVDQYDYFETNKYADLTKLNTKNQYFDYFNIININSFHDDNTILTFHGGNIRKTDLNEYHDILKNDSMNFDFIYSKYAPYWKKKPFGRKRWVKSIFRCNASNFIDYNNTLERGKIITRDTTYFDISEVAYKPKVYSTRSLTKLFLEIKINTLNINSLKFDFSDYTEVKSANPKPDSIYRNGFLYRDSLKIQQIYLNGLDATLNFPLNEPIEKTRDFIINGLITLLITLLAGSIWKYIVKIYKRRKRFSEILLSIKESNNKERYKRFSKHRLLSNILLFSSIYFILILLDPWNWTIIEKIFVYLFVLYIIFRLHLYFIEFKTNPKYLLYLIDFIIILSYFVLFALNSYSIIVAIEFAIAGGIGGIGGAIGIAIGSAIRKKKNKKSNTESENTNIPTSDKSDAEKEN